MKRSKNLQKCTLNCLIHKYRSFLFQQLLECPAVNPVQAKILIFQQAIFIAPNGIWGLGMLLKKEAEYVL